MLENLELNQFNEIIQDNNNNIDEIKFPNSINCIEILNKENKLILLLGTKNKILFYDIILKRLLNKINFINLRNISDILVLSDNNILICDNKNKFNLIEIKINFNKIKSKIISEFQGKENSSNIFSLKELHNGLIISGDCNNLIFWEKTYLNDNINNKNNNLSFTDKIKNICNNCLENLFNFLNEENNNEILNYPLKEIFFIPLTNTYSFIEIKEKIRDNNNIILSVAQPDTESVILFDISYINNNININNKKEIGNINSIINRKNIMTYKNGNIYVGCRDSIKVIKFIDINNVFLIKNISTGSISYINIYRDKFLFCAIYKNKSQYNFESTLIYFEADKSEKARGKSLIPIFEKNQPRRNGSIINIIFYYYNNEEYIISLGTDNKIVISHENFRPIRENYMVNLMIEYE